MGLDDRVALLILEQLVGFGRWHFLWLTRSRRGVTDEDDSMCNDTFMGGDILCSSDGCPATGSRVLNVLCDRRNAQMHASINNCLASRVSGLVCRISNWLRLALPGVFPGPTLFHPPSTTSQVLNQAEKTHEPGLVSPGSSTTPCRLFKLFAHVPRTPGGFSVQSPDWIDWAVALSLTRWHHLGQM